MTETNLLEKMSDLTLELGALSIITRGLISGFEVIKKEENETMLYFIHRILKETSENAADIRDNIDILLMTLKKQQ